MAVLAPKLNIVEIISVPKSGFKKLPLIKNDLKHNFDFKHNLSFLEKVSFNQI